MLIAPERVSAYLVELHRRHSLDAARELFDALGYQAADELPLQTRSWPTGVKRLLTRHAVAPIYLAQHGDFRVVYTHLATDHLPRAVERPIVEHTLDQLHPHALFIFADRDLTRWDFVNVKYSAEHGARRRSIRRIHVGPAERLHTAARRIAMLAVPAPDVSALVLQAIHDEAFDVGELAKQFHQDYVAAFGALCDEVSANSPRRGDEAEREAQLLLDRLLFLTFIETKGWLHGKHDYIAQHLQAYCQDDAEGTGFYTDFLLPLFVAMSTEGTGLPSLHGVPFLNGGLFDVAADAPQADRLTIGNGVFRQVFDDLLGGYDVTVREDTPHDVEVAVDPEMVGQILESVVMGGEHGADRREPSGFIFVPRVIVRFMCREALKEYLAAESGLDAARIGQLMDVGPAQQLTSEEVADLGGMIGEPEARLLRALVEGARVLDPAVGSGAFLVGMLREMVALTMLLDVRLHGLERVQRRNYDYDRKRTLIQRNLCGVDIRPEAVRICELRLWLSLMVDYDREPGEPMPTLPNVSDHIRVGDSLVERLFGEPVQLDQLAEGAAARQLIDRIETEKRDYFSEPNLWESQRRELRILTLMCELGAELVGTRRHAALMRISTEVPGLFDALGTGLLTERQRRVKEQAEAELARYDDLMARVKNVRERAQAMQTGDLPAGAPDVRALQDQLGPSFIWRLDFAGVFDGKGGFDVVIGNPPSAGAPALIAGEKEVYRSLYQSAVGGYDMSVLFAERGWRLLAPNGQLCFSQPDRFLRATAGRGLRKLLADHRAVRAIVGFGDAQAPSEATSDTCLLFLSTGGNSRFRYVRVDDPETWQNTRKASEREIDSDELTEQEWRFGARPEEPSSE